MILCRNYCRGKEIERTPNTPLKLEKCEGKWESELRGADVEISFGGLTKNIPSGNWKKKYPKRQVFIGISRLMGNYGHMSRVLGGGDNGGGVKKL